MRDQDTFLLADQALQTAIEQIGNDQWSVEVPPVFANSTGLPTLRDLVGHIAYDEAWVPHLLTGQTMDEVGSRNYGGDLLGEDPKGSYAELAAAARDSGRQANDLDRVVHCSFGDCSTEEYLWQLIVAR